MSDTKPSGTVLFETKRGKVVGRNVAIALGIACIILVAGIAGVMAFYTMQVNSLKVNHTYTDDQYNAMQANYQAAQNNYTNYLADHHHTDAEYDQAVASKPAKIVRVDLNGVDSRPFLGQPSLHVYGYLCNVGGVTATNVKLHVVAMQSGGVVAIDTDILLGSVGAESWVKVDGSPTYNGGALTGWTVTESWS